MTLKLGTSRIAPGTAQFATNLPTTLCVPQCTYAISKPGCRVEGLTTGLIDSCMALAGVNMKTGVVFLAHFDTPVMAHGVDMLVKDVKDANGGTLDGFVIHDVAGIPPRGTLLLLLLGLLIFFLTEASAWLFDGFQGHMPLSFFLSFSLTMFGVFYSSTRLWLYIRLCQLDAFQGKWVKYRRLNICNKKSKAWVRIGPKGEVTEGTGPNVDNKHFKTPKLSCLPLLGIWRIHRAPGSLFPQEASDATESQQDSNRALS